MEAVFEGINSVFGFIGPLSDFLWDFPTNFAWYANIPVLGSFSFAIILLLGSGIFFSFKLGFMQVTHFKKAIKILTEKRSVETGISPLAAFFLSSADPEPCSGCGYLLFSEWQLLIWRVCWHRYSRRKKKKSS